MIRAQVLIVLTVVGTWALGGCVEPAPLTLVDRPCPCLKGAYCCPITSRCVNEGEVCEAPDERPFLPMKAGLSYRYLVTDNNARTTSIRTQTVEKIEEVPVGIENGLPPDLEGMTPGRMAYKIVTVLTQRNTDSQESAVWQARVDEQVRRFREETFGRDKRVNRVEWWEPYRLRLDETPQRLQPPTEYNRTATYYRADRDLVDPTVFVIQETDDSANLKVRRIDEVITVAPGTFKCLRVVRGDHTYWYARGLGKVREEISEGAEIEELEDVTGL